MSKQGGHCTSLEHARGGFEIDSADAHGLVARRHSRQLIPAQAFSLPHKLECAVGMCTACPQLTLIWRRSLSFTIAGGSSPTVSEDTQFPMTDNESCSAKWVRRE